LYLLCSCHWCHVLEQEAFEVKEIADILNKYFISIKVDREERPDIDHLYMSYNNAVNGRGGWPQSVFMTYDMKPFYIGTYFPKEDMYNIPSFRNLITALGEEWVNNKQQVIEHSLKTEQEVNRIAFNIAKGEINISTVNTAVKEMEMTYERNFGGFSNAPKFPAPHKLLFLMDMNKDKEIVIKTLDSMYKGGIYDHIGGGFCRYSTDEKWLIPHFEKMIYDNALLAYTYGYAYNKYKIDLYKDIAEDIIRFILRDLKDAMGGCYSALDADSEGVEGKYYSFSYFEIEDILKDDPLKGEFIKYFNITKYGNFEGKNILNIIGNNINFGKFRGILNKLLEVRYKRVPPETDRKKLTFGDAMVISSLAYLGRIFNNSAFIAEAKDGEKFISENLIKNGRIIRYAYNNVPGFLEDYSYLALAYIELYKMDKEEKYLSKAKTISEEMLSLFYDEAEGSFFISGKDTEELLKRTKDLYDGAYPSGNSAAIHALVQLKNILKTKEYDDIISKSFYAAGGEVNKNQDSYTYLLLSYNQLPQGVDK
jgi:uncharacterized protein